MINLKLRHLIYPHKTIKLARIYFLKKPNRINLLANVLKIFTKFPKPKKWVFIVGCYNSGTTLLLKLLSTSSQISALNEGVFKTDQLVSPEELGWTRMWWKVQKEVRLTEANNYIDTNKLKKDWGLFFDKKKPIFLEKSIVNSARILWFRENFKNSYFIFIVRNGYAVAEGIRRKSPIGPWGIQQSKYKSSYPIEICAKQWVINNKVIEEDIKKLKKIKRVKYEDLCENPKKVLKNIYKFLGINKEVNWDVNIKWNISGIFSVIKNMNYRSFNNLTIEEIKKIEKVAKSSLEFYKYPILSKKLSFNNENKR